MTTTVPDDDDWLDALAAVDPMLGAWATGLAAGPTDVHRADELAMRIHSHLRPDDERLRWTVEWCHGPPGRSCPLASCRRALVRRLRHGGGGPGPT